MPVCSPTGSEEIIWNLRDFVDRFIIGSMQYCYTPRGFYADCLPLLITRLNQNKIDYYLKKGLRSLLPT